MSRGPLGTYTIPGPAGPLEVLHRPPEGAVSRVGGAALICHPHPRYGGTMHSRVVVHLARSLQGVGFATLRFNFRGVGLSGGRFDEGRGEREDARAALDHLFSLHPQADFTVAGFSFGAWVGLVVGAASDRVGRLVGIGAPLTLYDFEFLPGTGKKVLLIHGERDEFSPPDRAHELARRLGPRARLVTLPGADHFLEGALDRMRAVIHEEFKDFGERPA